MNGVVGTANYIVVSSPQGIYKTVVRLKVQVVNVAHFWVIFRCTTFIGIVRGNFKSPNVRKNMCSPVSQLGVGSAY